MVWLSLIEGGWQSQDDTLGVWFSWERLFIQMAILFEKNLYKVSKNYGLGVGNQMPHRWHHHL